MVAAGELGGLAVAAPDGVAEGVGSLVRAGVTTGVGTGVGGGVGAGVGGGGVEGNVTVTDGGLTDVSAVVFWAPKSPLLAANE